MSRAEQQDRVLSTSEDSLPSLHNSNADPLIQSRPLSDIFPFHSHADRSVVPSLLSGYGAQVQPVTAGPHANRLNGINSSSWSIPVIGQPEGKPHSSRIMRLFSNPRKGPFPAHSPTTDGSSSTHSNDSNSVPQSWSGLPGVGVVDSFKKLRSSVLQGIQSRGAVSQDGEHDPSDQDLANGTGVANFDPGLDDANHLKFADGYGVSNGSFYGRTFAAMSHCGSDIEDFDDEENEEGDGLTRNTRSSRSIRRAYGAGRISILDTGNRMVAGSGTSEATDSRKPDRTSSINVQTKNVNESTNVKVLSRLSRSAENLHIFKAPFRSKGPSPGPPLLQEDTQRTSTSNGTANIQRTASASSVDLQGHAVGSRKSPAMTKGPMLKLVGSMTDLTVRRRRSPSPSPTAPTPLSPLTHLHDDYSRRVPCLASSGRQRRPSPVRARVMSVERTPLVPLQPEYSDGPQQHQVLISLVSVEPPEGTEQTAHHEPHYESLTPATTGGYKGCDSSSLSHEEASQQQDQTEVNMLPNEATSDQQEPGALLQTEDVSPTTSSTPPISAPCLSESPTSPTDASTEIPSVKARRRSGRSRPRPISDYGQLVSRKHSIPEEVAELHDEGRTANTSLHRDCSGGDACGNGESRENCGINGDVQGTRQRPISVIGVVDLFSADTEEKDDRLPSQLLSRPPIPSHQVPPYRAVSARFRPSVLSQSTPIGLDRVGRRKLHRMLSDGMSECSTTLDDSVSEEEEGSFDELTDVTPYLQSGVELSVLNEWISSGNTVYAEALWLSLIHI